MPSTAILRFNEAGAMKPRKSRTTGELLDDKTSFNEAGAMKLRKSHPMDSWGYIFIMLQ